ncbi:TatD family hydrolase [Candidatus Uhrbacteria bacterium]|nr:TatD family hydrolase [Candidatus Uhrbacteria bacterium]
MTFIDSHCHVHFRAYDADMDEVIKRTLAAGVFLITVGTQKDTSRHGLEVAARYEGMWATVGLHPNHLTKQEFLDEAELEPVKTREETFDMEVYRELARHPKCVAIGETGLDYYRIPESADVAQVKEKQRATVRAHFDLASEANLPVSIHCRDAYGEQASLIAEYVQAGKLARRGVIHCFTGTAEEARAFIELGFLISFSGIVTFSKNVQATARALPLESLLIETDSPYLTPAPNRGGRNEPWRVKDVARKLAELKGVSVEDVARVTTANAQNLFRLPPEGV